MSHVFISYAKEDWALARQLSDGLQTAGYTAWHYGHDSLPGHNYIEEFGQAIEECSIFYFLSPASLASNQIQTEIFIAHEASKAVHAGVN